MTESPRATPDQGSAELSDRQVWRCFHCDEVFTTVDAAIDHFGPSIYSDPACTIDAHRLRELEAELARYRQEDTDLHREIHRMHGVVRETALREEEKGYARGLRDMPLGIYEAIAHGDEKHRAWLKQAIEAYCSGRPVEREATATQPAPRADLYWAILKLPCRSPQTVPGYLSAYQMGHRDARHAAAELVAAQGAPTPAQAGHKPMQGLADWLRAIAETQAADTEQEAVMRQWAREVDVATGTAGDAGKTGESAASSAMGDDGDGTPEQEAFCAGNCCWSGHHPDCFRASPSPSNESEDNNHG